VGDEYAPFSWLAGVIGARVFVVAFYWGGPGNALPRITVVPFDAGVAIATFVGVIIGPLDFADRGDALPTAILGVEVALGVAKATNQAVSRIDIVVALPVTQTDAFRALLPVVTAVRRPQTTA
jgi:prolipoprotein diacylglyceryltransferase